MVHLFGAVSSPGCGAADDGEFEFGEAAANFVRNNFYVDDGLISVSSVKEAIDLLQNRRDLCARAGLKLHKVLSNKLKFWSAYLNQTERPRNHFTFVLTLFCWNVLLELFGAFKTTRFNLELN